MIASSPRYSLDYTRRKYGNTTYTWVNALIDGVWHSLGDPWPCAMPPRDEILAAIESIRTVPGRSAHLRLEALPCHDGAGKIVMQSAGRGV